MQIKKVYSLVTTDIQNTVFDHPVFVEVRKKKKGQILFKTAITNMQQFGRYQCTLYHAYFRLPQASSKSSAI